MRALDRLPVRARGPVHRSLRSLALLLLLAAVVDLLSNLVPRQAPLRDLLDDVRAGRTSVVHVFYTAPDAVGVRWTTGFADDKELTHRFETLPAGEGGEAAFEALVRKELAGNGGGVPVAFDREDPLEGLGGLSALVPVLYWRFISTAWLAWAVLLAGATILVDIVVRARLRAPSAGYWLTACLVFGAGFPAYLWSEPAALWRPTADGRIGGGGVVGRTALWAAGVVALAVTMAATR
ncbi:hypothetical protein [Streptomyces sp. NPDC050585]|uniref:hypothetical protein n=1 Tax=Streptomyces sp. NPDC050585 TaxID=3365632 RepID=UPI00378CD922